MQTVDRAPQNTKPGLEGARAVVHQTNVAASETAVPHFREGIFGFLRRNESVTSPQHDRRDPTGEVVAQAVSVADRLLHSAHIHTPGSLEQQQCRTKRLGLVHALVAADVYNDVGGKFPLPTGVTRLEGEAFHDAVGGKIDSSTLSDKRSGYFAALYYDAQEKTFIFANRGTNDGPDWIADLRQAPGLKTSQYEHAIKLARDFSRVVQTGYSQEFKLVFVGHSLGGGLSTAQAEATGKPAVTFNPAGLNNATVKRAGVEPGNNERIVSFVVEREILTNLQDKLNGGLGMFGDKLVPEARGRVITLNPGEQVCNIALKEPTERHRMHAVLRGLLNRIGQ